MQELNHSRYMTQAFCLYHQTTCSLLEGQRNLFTLFFAQLSNHKMTYVGPEPQWGFTQLIILYHQTTCSLLEAERTYSPYFFLQLVLLINDTFQVTKWLLQDLNHTRYITQACCLYHQPTWSLLLDQRCLFTLFFSASLYN